MDILEQARQVVYDVVRPKTKLYDWHEEAKKKRRIKLLSMMVGITNDPEGYTMRCHLCRSHSEPIRTLDEAEERCRDHKLQHLVQRD